MSSSNPPVAAAVAGAVGPARSVALTRFVQSTDLALVVLVVAIISLMVIPMPLYVMDALIALNIMLSVALLMLAVYVPGPLALSTFPTLLLFTTLFRLSLNIASTKLILLTGNGGHIIETFGKLVVGGNVVVGLVVFIIIALVQFIVVAKGSERVAEVGARFTLDAMPGKQMSIDADLRAGNISKEEAKRRREELEMESQFHGAMDGAMKFVKGDAIAGLVIAFVNITAGVAVGVLMANLTVAESAQRYTILSVGDGMVTQIPSLFVSIAAGVLITRVSSRGEEGRANLGRQIGKQFLSQPTALIYTGCILLLFLVVPGFPKIIFATLGLATLGLAMIVRKQIGRPDRVEDTPMPAMSREGRRESPQLVQTKDATFAEPLAVGVGLGLHEAIDATVLNTEFEQMRKRLRSVIGLPFPGVSIFADPDIDLRKYVVLVHELPLSGGELVPGWRRLPANVPPEALAGIEQRRINGTTVPAEQWVPDSAVALLQERGVQVVGNERALALRIEGVIVANADTFIGIEETQQLVNEASVRYPELSQELLRSMPLQRVADVLRRLVQEGISIRHLREIFESLINWGPREKDIVMLVEYVRVDLGRFTAFRFGLGRGNIDAIVLDPRVEQLVRQSIQQTLGGSYVALSQEHSARIVQSVSKACEAVTTQGHTPVLAASMDVRRYVRKVIEAALPNVPVLSYQEIGNHAVIRPASMVEA
jgi:type III secretion protein V